jgi:hypothetical protein
MRTPTILAAAGVGVLLAIGCGPPQIAGDVQSAKWDVPPGEQSAASAGAPHAFQPIAGNSSQMPSERVQETPSPSVIFTLLDADGDRTLSPDEIQRASELLLQLDRNRDGFVTHRELIEWENRKKYTGIPLEEPASGQRSADLPQGDRPT